MLLLKALPHSISMMKSVLNRLGFCLLPLLSAQLALAQPVGEGLFHFDASDAPVWDVSGMYVLDTPMKGAGDQLLPVSYPIQIEHDASGKLRGQGFVFVIIGDDVVAGEYTVSGGVSGGGQTTKVNFSVTVRGNDFISGAYRKFSIRANYRMVIDSESRSLDGEMSGSVSINGFSSAKLADDELSLPLPEGVEGAWYISYRFLPLSKFQGTGSMVVSDYDSPDTPIDLQGDRVLDGKISGSYSSNSRSTSLSFKGVNEGRGATISLKFTDEKEVTKLSFRVLGQAFKL